MKLHVIKTNIGLVPAYNSDRDKLTDAKLKLGECYEVDIKKTRNIKHHRKFFALLNLMFDNQDIFEVFEDFRYWAIMKAGYYKRIETKEGEVFIPISISFANMDQTYFDKLYSDMVDLACRFLDTSNDLILSELENYF